MDANLCDPPDVIAKRLLAVRLSLGYEHQDKFAKQIGVAKNTYNPFETGERTLSWNVALLIRKRFHIPVEWLFFGENEDRLPAKVDKYLQRTG